MREADHLQPPVPCKELGFYSECSGKPWKGFMQGSGMAWFTIYEIIN